MDNTKEILQIRYIFNTIWAILLLISYLVFSYYTFNGWWYSSIGTGLILIFSYLIWRKDFLKVIGLKLSIKSFLKTIGLTILIIIGSVLIIKYIGSKKMVAIQFGDISEYYHDMFYILNEEIILGGIAIYILVNRFKIKPLLVSTGLALIFSLIHFVFYKWILYQTGLIETQTLITSFFVAFIRNNLIIVNRHIGYSWALHLGWIVVMLGSFPYWIDTNIELTEPESFNIFLGSKELLILSCVLAGLSLIYMIKKVQPTIKNIRYRA